jgi:hypothetical protein
VLVGEPLELLGRDQREVLAVARRMRLEVVVALDAAAGDDCHALVRVRHRPAHGGYVDRLDAA